MSLFNPHGSAEDRHHLDQEAHAILALAGELKALCQRIAAATDLEVWEVGGLARELLDGSLTIEDATCSCRR